MPETIEGLFIFVLLLLPGFVAFRVSSYFSPPSPREESQLDQVLSSLAVSVSIFVFLAALACAALLGLSLADKAKFDGLRLDILVDEGPDAYVLEQPVLALLVPMLGFLATIVIAALVGWLDPVDRLLSRVSIGRGLTTTDQWYEALHVAREAAGARFTYVSIQMKGSRDVFQGIVRGFSFQHKPGESRDLVLENVTYIPEGDSARRIDIPGDHPGTNSGAILRAGDIDSVIIVYSS